MKYLLSLDNMLAYFQNISTHLQALVDRLTGVQEDNCALRRQIQNLHMALAAKSQALQSHLSNQLIANTPRVVRTSSPGSHNSGVASSPRSDSNFPSSWFPFSKTITDTANSSSTSTALSLLNVDTVNRLKVMCEDLLTQNMRLTADLETLRATKWWWPRSLFVVIQLVILAYRISIWLSPPPSPTLAIFSTHTYHCGWCERPREQMWHEIVNL